MRGWLGAIALMGVLGGAASAQEGWPLDTAPPLAETTGERGVWAAVGRLELEDGAFCTGTLIAPTLVLTAAHCLHDPARARPLNVGEVAFRTGDGILRPAMHLLTHPGYVPDGDVLAQVPFDLALVQIEGPPAIAPIGLRDGLEDGDVVTVISYARGRPGMPIVQESCHAIGHRAGALVLGCAVDFGASGGPVLVFNANGARIVSVVSAKAELGSRGVAIAAPVAQPMAVLMALAAVLGFDTGERSDGAASTDTVSRKAYLPSP